MVNYHRLAKIALILSVIVIMLGAYTRLTDAGLGCPDWPGCYGRMVLPHDGPALTASQQVYPDLPIVQHKAWTEMVHRYVAGILGILILILASWSIFERRRGLSLPLVAPLILVGILVFQAILGMWTVTLKLLPLVVTGHLLGGMTIAALLSWVCAVTSTPFKINHVSKGPSNALKIFTVIGLIILIFQLFLGAWTSTNYSALACGSEFPDCHTQIWPEMDWKAGFNILSPVGPNYEGGLLDMTARTAIHMAHRYWALITFIYLMLLSGFLIISRHYVWLRKWGVTLLTLLCVQIILGIVNVVKLLPLANAVAHNGVAVLLLVTLVFILERVFHRANVLA